MPDKMVASTAGAKRRRVQRGFQLDRCIERVDRCGARSAMMLLHSVGENGLWRRLQIKHAGCEDGKRYQA